jgi:hypothetical protein
MPQRRRKRRGLAEKRECDVKSPLQTQDDENLWSLEIPEFGGLGAAQHPVADEGEFGDQFIGICAG